MPATIPPALDTRTTDQRVTLSDVTWTGLETLELMSPSFDHEGIKTIIGRLLETWALETDIELNGFGSWTLKNQIRSRALEPDECYSVGTARPTRPDLAIEVIWTSVGIDKLEVYRGLDVGEVWIWRERRIEVHALVDDRYERREGSALFPDLDLAELARHVDAGNQTDAVRRYRDALRSGSSRRA